MIVVGDVHGNWRDLAERVYTSGVHGAHIIQVGDFGLGFNTPQRERELLAPLHRALRNTESVLHVVRGNHDDPAYWRPGHNHHWQYDTIRLVPDYTVLSVQGARILCVGGALSIDRILRRRNHSYWPDEGVVLDEGHLAALNLTDLWGVITHTAPDIAPPFAIDSSVRGYLDIDPPLADDLRHERAALTQLCTMVRTRTSIPTWAYGHFHGHAEVLHEGTRFILADVVQWLDI